MTGALVDDRAAADVERRGGHGAGVVRGGEGGHVADVVEGRRPLQHGVPLDVVHDRLAPIEALGEGLDGRQAIVNDIEGNTMLKRAATLDDVGNVAAFAASDHARTMTATALNISCGAIVD